MTAPEPALVSIIVSLHNASRFVQEAIGSLLGQTHQRLEVIVVDNASTDDGPAKVARIKDPRLELIHSPENRLYPTAWNHGFAKARGEWVVFTHADDRHHPEFVEKLLGKVRSGSFDVACCWLRAIDPEGVRDEVQAPAYEERQNRPAYDFADWRQLKWECPFVTPSQLWRREFAARLMPFEPGLISANYSWQLKAAALGWRGTLVCEPLFDLRLHPESLSSKTGPQTYFLHWIYSHLTGYRPIVAAQASQPRLEIRDCHAELAKGIAESAAARSAAGPRLVQASLRADRHEPTWPDHDAFLAEICGDSPGNGQPAQDFDFTLLLDDYAALLGEHEFTLLRREKAGLTDKMQRAMERARRLRSELDRLKRKKTGRLRHLADAMGKSLLHFCSLLRREIR